MYLTALDVMPIHLTTIDSNLTTPTSELKSFTSLKRNKGNHYFVILLLTDFGVSLSNLFIWSVDQIVRSFPIIEGDRQVVSSSHPPNIFLIPVL